MNFLKVLKAWVSENPIGCLLGLAVFFGITTFASLCTFVNRFKTISYDHLFKPYFEGETAPLWIFLMVLICPAYVIFKSFLCFLMTPKRGKLSYKGWIYFPIIDINPSPASITYSGDLARKM